MTSSQRLAKMMDSFDKCAESEGSIQKMKIECDHDIEKMCLQMEHEREMAKIRVSESKLALEREKCALCCEQLHVEAAALGHEGTLSSTGAGDAGSEADTGNNFEEENFDHFDD